MSLTFVHCSDLHIDRNFNYGNAERSELRKKDIEHNFTEIVNCAIKERCSLFLITGDIFDRVNPSNAARSYLVSEIKRLKDHNVETFLIGGNHDVPKLGNYTLAIEILKSAGLSTVFSNSLNFQEKIISVSGKTIQIIGKSYYSNDQSQNPFRNFSVDKKGIQICLIHGSLLGMNVAPNNPFDSSYNPFGTSDIPPSVDYLALGHYHNHFERKTEKTTVCNPGSIDRLTWSEASDKKGFAYVELNSDSSSLSFIPLKTREFRLLELTVDKDITDIHDFIIKHITDYQNPEDILRLSIRGDITREQQRNLRIGQLIEASNQLFFHSDFNFDLTLEGYGKIFLDKMVSPLDAYEKHLEDQIKSSSSQEQRQFLERAKMVGSRYLGAYIDNQ